MKQIRIYAMKIKILPGQQKVPNVANLLNVQCGFAEWAKLGQIMMMTWVDMFQNQLFQKKEKKKYEIDPNHKV